MGVLELESDLQATDSGLSAALSEGYSLHVDVLEPWLCRVAISPAADSDMQPSWMVAPKGDVPWEGRSRLSTTGFSCPAATLQNSDLQSSAIEGREQAQPYAPLVLASDNVRVEIQETPLAINIYRFHDSQWQRCFEDRPVAAYRNLAGRGQILHAQTRNLKHRHVGLGDKAGPFDRTGKRFRCLQTDALGYNAETSDPLYKHVPWFMFGNSTDGYTGLFYDTLSEIHFDFGAEHSNYHAHYRQTDVYENALVFYVLTSHTIKELVTQFQCLTGKPHFHPRWALGFAHTSMHLADADNAQYAIQSFCEETRERSMPMSAVHSGSGYTTIDGRRYVFTWNNKKFPDKKTFFKKIASMGLYSCANTKPVLLNDHPLFADVAAFGGFIKDKAGVPVLEMFWGGLGASLDFTNPKTISWWQKGIQEQVLGAGFDSVWNDNNECEIWDEDALLDGFGKPVPAMNIRPIQALLMTRASFEATREASPQTRPYTITRAGPVGISRYAQTWSGDNKTSWHTLHWNLANGLNMSLSGFPLLGHDIGGFDGPTPSSELLCRWVEMMVLHPRAVMNSWKPDATTPMTSPWMHESVVSQIKDMLTLRYQFLPWLYHLSWRAHVNGELLISPMFYHFTDSPCETDQSQFMLGDSVLVAPVTQPGVVARKVYLPKHSQGWYAWIPGAEPQWYSGGQSVQVQAPLGQLPVFIAAGAIIPIAKAWDSTAPHDALEIQITVFPGEDAGENQQSLFSDDGVSWSFENKDASLLEVVLKWNQHQVDVTVSEQWSGVGRVKLDCKAVGLNGRSLNVSMPE